MPLMSCPECSGQVSDTAVACPHCGYSVAVYAARTIGISKGLPTAAVINSCTAAVSGIR